MNDLIKSLDEFQIWLDNRMYPYGENWKFNLKCFYNWLKNYKI